MLKQIGRSLRKPLDVRSHLRKAQINIVEGIKSIPDNIVNGIAGLQTKYYKRMTKHYQKLIDRMVWSKPMLRDLPKYFAINFGKLVKYFVKNLGTGVKAWKYHREEADFYKDALGDWERDEEGFFKAPECGSCSFDDSEAEEAPEEGESDAKGTSL